MTLRDLVLALDITIRGTKWLLDRSGTEKIVQGWESKVILVSGLLQFIRQTVNMSAIGEEIVSRSSTLLEILCRVDREGACLEAVVAQLDSDLEEVLDSKEGQRPKRSIHYFQLTMKLCMLTFQLQSEKTEEGVPIMPLGEEVVAAAAGLALMLVLLSAPIDALSKPNLFSVLREIWDSNTIMSAGLKQNPRWGQFLIHIMTVEPNYLESEDCVVLLKTVLPVALSQIQQPEAVVDRMQQNIDNLIRNLNSYHTDDVELELNNVRMVARRIVNVCRALEILSQIPDLKKYIDQGKYNVNLREFFQSSSEKWRSLSEFKEIEKFIGPQQQS